jgi:hypothetical protein
MAGLKHEARQMSDHHVLFLWTNIKDVDARHKAGHDELSSAMWGFSQYR